MQQNVLALDYDGTLAKDGHVDEPTITALQRWRGAGGRLILVTGRRLEPLLEVFPALELFQLAVVENGALLYHPEARKEEPLAAAPPPAFLERLRERNVPYEVGRVIVATWTPHETTVLEVIRDLGMDWTITFNKGAVMALPAGINKASGLEAGLKELGLSPRQTIGVGDAENDEDFFRLCQTAVAVGNALPSIKDLAHLVTQGERGAGVVECIERFLNSSTKLKRVD